jgi:hypothetical protein
MSARSLKERMQRVGAVKAADAADALREHLRLPIGERIEAAIVLSQVVLQATPLSAPSSESDKEELAAFTRVAAHFRRLMARHG